MVPKPIQKRELISKMNALTKRQVSVIFNQDTNNLVDNVLASNSANLVQPFLIHEMILPVLIPDGVFEIPQIIVTKTGDTPIDVTCLPCDTSCIGHPSQTVAHRLTKPPLPRPSSRVTTAHSTTTQSLVLPEADRGYLAIEMPPLNMSSRTSTDIFPDITSLAVEGVIHSGLSSPTLLVKQLAAKPDSCDKVDWGDSGNGGANVGDVITQMHVVNHKAIMPIPLRLCQLTTSRSLKGDNSNIEIGT